MMSGNPYLHTGARTTRLVSCSSLPGRTATRGGKLKSFVHNCPSSPGRRWRCRKWNGGSGQGRAGTRKIDGGGRHVFRGWGHSPSDTQATGATGSCQVSCLFYSLDDERRGGTSRRRRYTVLEFGRPVNSARKYSGTAGRLQFYLQVPDVPRLCSSKTAVMSASPDLLEENLASATLAEGDVDNIATLGWRREVVSTLILT